MLEIVSVEISDVKLIKPRFFYDARGFFQQTFHEAEYRAAGIDVRFVQDNWSRSSKGVLRGLHYQLSNAQDKLVYVVRGEIFDVAVDIRRESPTFGKWCGALLTEENHHQLFVPKGFAHGFLVMSETADVFYKCSNLYTPGDEYGILWNDPALKVEWPDINCSPVISDKDLINPVLNAVPEENLPLM